MKTERTKSGAIAEPKGKLTGPEGVVLEKKSEHPNHKQVVRITGEDDDYWSRLEADAFLIKKALGIDDNEFCKEIANEVYGLGGLSDNALFDFVVSVLKDSRPVDKLHALLSVQMAVVHLCTMKQAQVLLKPIRFELPPEFRTAMRNAMMDLTRLDPQKIKIDDQPVRQGGERAFSRLTQTYAMQLAAHAGYRKASQISESATDEAILGGDTVKNGTPRSSRGLNGSRQSAAHCSSGSKQEMNSITLRKSNGHASS